MVILLAVNSGLEVAGLGAIIPLVLVVLEEGAVSSNEWLRQVNSVFHLSENQFILLIGVSVLLFLLIKNIISIYIGYLQSKFTFELQGYFSQNLFRAFYKRGLLYFKEKNSTSVLRNINAVPSSFATGVVLPLISFLTEVIVIILVAGGLLWYDPMILGILALVIGPTFGLLYTFSKNRVKFYQEQIHALSPKLAQIAFEAIYGFTDVKITGTEEHFFERHSEIQNEMIKHYTGANTFKLVPQKVIEFSMFLGVITIMIYGIFHYNNRSELIQLIGVFALAAYRVIPSVNRFMMAIMSIKSFEYTIEVMERKDAQSIHIANNEIPAFQCFESLEVKGLSFSFNETTSVLKDVDFSLKKGELIGLIGESGSGKSTFMNILLGFYPIQDGVMKVNGEDLSFKDMSKWQHLIGFVSQDVFMKDASVLENIAFGVEKDEVDEVKAWECLRLASLEELIKSLPQGIHSPMGERGGQLSGGQRQRIGIARALYSGAKVLFFDEATSALDHETEQEVTEAIHHLAQSDLTMVIIAHRYTTLKYCSKILEMKNGSWYKEHTYESLMKQVI